jgi:hypothetical protein
MTRRLIAIGSDFLKRSQGTRRARCPIISDVCLSEGAAKFFLDAAWQRCVVH